MADRHAVTNRLPLKDRLREHPMFDANDTCGECHDVIWPKSETFEYSNNYICINCFIRHVDEGEAKLEGDR